MRSFFKIFLASFVALAVFTLIAFLIFFVIVAGITTPAKPQIGDKAVLTIDLSKQYKEQRQDNPLGALVSKEEDVPSLYEVVSMIRFAKSDSSIKGIYIKCNTNANGYAASQEIRNAIADYKKIGKFVYAYGEVISQGAYYVASVADKVYCNPKGMVEWNGLSTTLIFFKGTLEKLQIQPQIFYAGKFKSATEPFREYKMTDANRLQTSVYLGDLYAQILLTAAQHAKKDTATLHRLADNGNIKNASDALQNGLIDGVRYDDEVRKEILDQLKLESTAKINMVSLDKYSKGVDFKKSGSNKIALIVAEGEIIDGKGRGGQVGSEDFLEIIRKARLDKTIKAIVFRVNSPGGSSLASEVILRELLLAKKAKPVVVSFGDVAASGGYYIASGADSIFAQPNTITGSIGVFALIPNMQGFLNNKLGMTFDRVKTGPFADMISIDRPLSAGEKMFIQQAIDTIYHDFKSRVATGRKLSMAFVDSIAQGRVWTGERAKQIGLVDRVGNIQDAVDCALRMAKVTDYRIKEYPEKKSLFESLFSSYKTEIKSKSIKEEIGVEQYDLLQRLKQLRSMFYTPQARMPFGVSFN
ncbi:MAG: signal peptide peptidase SppA [Chitinophagaceae bacterium]|nr:signal peptide peptidase SppA [Chitinophagaceae bacterium]